MGDGILITMNTTSNRHQEPDESVLCASNADSREVSVGGFHPILTRGNRVGYRNWGVKSSAGF
jgi:hypothetical protein